MLTAVDLYLKLEYPCPQYPKTKASDPMSADRSKAKSLKFAALKSSAALFTGTGSPRPRP
ncbi:MAG TPA: hypothetical protein DIW17_00910 [Clostridiales bacterium]|nr:hypothetical protein [Clostridiales bacterium]